LSFLEGICKENIKKERGRSVERTKKRVELEKQRNNAETRIPN
jgi:hypothetical protein